MKKKSNGCEEGERRRTTQSSNGSLVAGLTHVEKVTPPLLCTALKFMHIVSA